MTTTEKRFIELFWTRMHEGMWMEDDEYNAICSEMKMLEKFIDKDKVKKKMREMAGIS